MNIAYFLAFVVPAPASAVLRGRSTFPHVEVGTTLLTSAVL